MTSFWGVTLKWCIGISMLTRRWREGGSGNRLDEIKRKDGEKRNGAERGRRKGESEGCYKCSGEIWETVQDFHYLWCKLSDPVIRPLISLSLIFVLFSFSLSYCNQWSTVWGAAGRRPPFTLMLAGAPGMAQCLGVPFRVNPPLTRGPFN